MAKRKKTPPLRPDSPRETEAHFLTVWGWEMKPAGYRSVEQDREQVRQAAEDRERLLKRRARRTNAGTFPAAPGEGDR